ncbi:MAG: serine/threonine-protein kinase [Nannocystaceae bacterium]
MSAARPWTVFARPAEATPSAPLEAPGRRRGGAGSGRHLYLSPALRADRSGEVIGERYELVERLGSGGMSEVYRARFLATRRTVALKLLDPIFAGEPEMIWRFRHEFLILANLEHPHLVRAHDMAITGAGEPYFTMEWIRGGSLEELLRRRARLDPAAAVALGRQLCGALAALHARGVIHRDVKPGNVLLEDAGPGGPRIKLCDLGIAKITAHYYLDTTLYMTPPAERLHTGRAMVLGTPGYLPPEAGEVAVDPRADVYALGVLLYRAVTGRMPHAAPHGAAQGDPPRRFAALDLEALPPADLEEVILAALAPASARYQTIAEVDEALASLAIAPTIGWGVDLPRGGKARRSRARRRRRAPGRPTRRCPNGPVLQDMDDRRR